MGVGRGKVNYCIDREVIETGLRDFKQNQEEKKSVGCCLDNRTGQPRWTRCPSTFFQ